MPEEESQGKQVDRSEFAANLAIYGWPFLVILIGAVVLSIEQNYGETSFVQWLKTGQMNGAMSSLESTQEFDGNRGNLERDYTAPPTSVNPQIGQEWMGSWGSCGTYNNPDVLAGMSDPNGDGVRDTFDATLPTVRTAWDMVPLTFAGSTDGPFYIVANNKIIEVRSDLSDPRFESDANGKQVCVISESGDEISD